MIYNLYSGRIKDAEGNPEVFIYNRFPQSFRNRFFTIINNLLYDHHIVYVTKDLCEVFAQEKGLKSITSRYSSDKNTIGELEKYIDSCNDIDFLDLTDFIFGGFISNEVAQNRFKISDDDNSFEESMRELNNRNFG